MQSSMVFTMIRLPQFGNRSNKDAKANPRWKELSSEESLRDTFVATTEHVKSPHRCIRQMSIWRLKIQARTHATKGSCHAVSLTEATHEGS
jgi:hypothetical protein